MSAGELHAYFHLVVHFTLVMMMVMKMCCVKCAAH